MNITIYSVFTAFLWFNVFVLMLCFVRWKFGVFLGYSLAPLIMLFVLSTARLFLPIEPSFAVVVPSERILPFLQELLRKKIISIGMMQITCGMAAGMFLPLVSVVLLVRMLFLVHRKMKQIKTYTPTEDVRLLSIFEQVKGESPSRRKCCLYISTQCPGPCIFSLASSVILLPEEILSLSDQDLYYILKHEWQHHLANDVPVKLFIEGLCCILWWNPFVYLLKHNLNHTLELKCDAKVTNSLGQGQRITYTEALLHTLRLCVNRKSNFLREQLISIPFLGMAVSSKTAANTTIVQRFNAVLESDTRNKKIGFVSGAFLVVLFILSFCFVMQPYGLPPEEDLMEDMRWEVSSGLLQVTPKTSLLVDNQDGTYTLFINGECWHDITAKARTQEPYQSLPIITMSKEDEN